jgi:hypothetical protein
MAVMDAESVRAVWINRHDNGWQTYAIKNADGTYSAWAAPEGQTPGVDYIEMDPETAMTAAMFALKQKSGHDTCSTACSGWELHTEHDYERARGAPALTERSTELSVRLAAGGQYSYGGERRR